MDEDILKNQQDELREISDWLTPRERGYLEALSETQRFLEVKIPLVLSKGEIKILTGYRAQHNNALGPYKGGIRFSKEVSAREIKGLSMIMTWKCSLANLPFGGAKGGITFNPQDFTLNEIEKISRAYVRSIADFIGPQKDIPAPDLNTNPQIIAWMTDEFSKIQHRQSLDSFTGKPENKGGLKGRVMATGWGGVVILETLRKKLKFQPQKTTIAIQGFGNVGSNFALFANQKGYRIVAITEAEGGVLVEKGVDVNATLRCRQKNGKIEGCYCTNSLCRADFGKRITNQDLLEMPVDVLVLAAVENVITQDNARHIKARYIIELANGAVTKQAYEILSKKHIVVVPDILANAGGVIASYLEWKQNQKSTTFEREEVFREISRKLQASFKKTWQLSQRKKIPLKKACMILAVKRVIKAMREKH